MFLQSTERTQRLFEWLDAAELPAVSRAVTFAERAGLERVARAATRLGNGTLYPVLSAFLLAVAPLDAPLRYLLSSALSVLLAFGTYPLLKQFLARTRPCDYAPSLARLPEPLDRYSCPSGHTMTAVAYAMPLVFACPEAAPAAVVLCGVIGWSRVALGHHYVSDVLAGAVIGASVGLPVAMMAY